MGSTSNEGNPMSTTDTDQLVREAFKRLLLRRFDGAPRDVLDVLVQLLKKAQASARADGSSAEVDDLRAAYSSDRADDVDVNSALLHVAATKALRAHGVYEPTD